MKLPTKDLLSAKQAVLCLVGRCLFTAVVDSVNIPHAAAGDYCLGVGDQDCRDDSGLHFVEFGVGNLRTL